MSKPLGVKIFGWVIILSSLSQINKLAFSYEWCKEVFGSSWPLWLIDLRYYFSIALRILGIYAGVGILSLKESGRKIMIGICIFTVLTLYWKHPYAAFARHTRLLDQQYADWVHAQGAPVNVFSTVTIPALIIFYMLEIIFNAGLIYCFTRPKIKALFDKASG